MNFLDVLTDFVFGFPLNVHLELSNFVHLELSNFV